MGIGLRFALYCEWASLKDFLKHKPDRVITYMTIGVWLMLLCAKFSGKKIYLIYADDLPELYRKKSRLVAWIVKRIANPLTAKLAHHIVCTAQALKNDLAPYSYEITVLRNGVNKISRAATSI